MPEQLEVLEDKLSYVEGVIARGYWNFSRRARGSLASEEHYTLRRKLKRHIRALKRGEHFATERELDAILTEAAHA